MVVINGARTSRDAPACWVRLIRASDPRKALKSVKEASSQSNRRSTANQTLRSVVADFPGAGPSGLAPGEQASRREPWLPTVPVPRATRRLRNDFRKFKIRVAPRRGACRPRRAVASYSHHGLYSPLGGHAHWACFSRKFFCDLAQGSVWSGWAPLRMRRAGS